MFLLFKCLLYVFFFNNQNYLLYVDYLSVFSHKILMCTYKGKFFFCIKGIFLHYFYFLSVIYFKCYGFIWLLRIIVFLYISIILLFFFLSYLYSIFYSFFTKANTLQFMQRIFTFMCFCVICMYTNFQSISIYNVT